MKTVRITNTTRGVLLADRALLAATHWTRLRGLLARPRIRRGEGLVLAPSHGVHTYGMGYPIDIVFVDSDGRITALYPVLPPGQRTRPHGEACRAIELPGGTIVATGTQPGDRVELTAFEATPPPGAPSEVHRDR